MSTQYVACDLGAESGRIMLGTLDQGKLSLEEIHRFPNVTIRLGNSIRWDILRTFDELKKGLALVAARGAAPASLSVDSWGVDYVWSGLGQQMLAPAYIYRDPRTEPAYEKALASTGPDKIFSCTGIQFMPINTLYQLLADLETSPELVRRADGFLCIADYLNFLFSGVRRAEESLASTTQIYDPTKRDWSRELIAEFSLPAAIFPQVVPSGTILGPLSPEVQTETGLQGGLQVIASCSHDTGAAVAAVPASPGEDWAFLSCGTWSLIGVELPSPAINREIREANFTNEAGFGGTTRFLKNIVGLWILQESRRDWERQGQVMKYPELDALAEGVAPLQTLLDPDDPRFLKPGDMLAKIGAFARETGQPEPSQPGEFARAILESLALLYRLTLEKIEHLTGRKIRVLHIVGGGSQSRLFNQFIADAIGRTVLAGPVEATAAGNILVQAIAAGDIASLADLRTTTKNSFPISEFQPSENPAWAEALERFQVIRARRVG